MIDATQAFHRYNGRSDRCNQTRPSTPKSDKSENGYDCDGETAFYIDGLNVRMRQNQEVTLRAREPL